MHTDRREFLRYSLTVLGAAAAGTAAYKIAAGCGGTNTSSASNAQGNTSLSHNEKNLAARRGIPGRKWIMVIDLAKCDGCGKCQSACSAMHFVPPDRQWIKVNRMQDAENTAPYYFPQPCYHCDNPPCTKVCPVDATFKRQDGIVLVDNERCIGCRFCMAACPYNARSFNWGHPHDPPQAMAKEYTPEDGYPRRIGTVEKCDFCPDMAAMGMLPGCAGGCPMGAIYYGDENEDAVTNSAGDTQRLSKLLLDKGGYRFMEELGTKPRVYYLPAKDRKYAPPYWDKKHPIAAGNDSISPPLCGGEPGQRPGLTEVNNIPRDTGLRPVPVAREVEASWTAEPFSMGQRPTSQGIDLPESGGQLS